MVTTGAAGQTTSAGKTACVAGLAGSSCVLNIVRNESPTAAFDPDRPAAWIDSTGCVTAALIDTVSSNLVCAVWNIAGSPAAVGIPRSNRGRRLPKSDAPLPLREAGLIASVGASGAGIRIGLRPAVVSPAGDLVAAEEHVDTFFVPAGTTFACWLWHIPNASSGNYCPTAALAELATKGPHPENGSLALGAVPIEVFTDGSSVRQVVTKDSQQIAVIKR